MSPRIIDSCMGADGVWRVKVRGGALGLTSWATVEEIERLAAAARAEVAKRMAEPDLGPNLPCCGYPRAECECDKNPVAEASESEAVGAPAAETGSPSQAESLDVHQEASGNEQSRRLPPRDLSVSSTEATT